MPSSLSAQYKKQYKWRDWATVFKLMPSLNKLTILDLGCGIGDQTALLSQRGASVIGIDQDSELLEQARKKNILNSKFIEANIADLSKLDLPKVNGIWCSFTTAYFPHVEQPLKSWLKHLKPGGWLAVTEMSGLLNHSPLSIQTQSAIQSFYQLLFDKNLYDFNMGKNFEKAINALSLKLKQRILLEDKELSQNGKLSKDVIEAWENRLERMKGLQNYLGDKYNGFKEEFIACLNRKDHISNCSVYFYLIKCR